MQPLDVNAINAELCRQLYAKLGLNIPTPTPSTHGITNASNSPAVQEFKQSPTTRTLDDKETLLIDWYREFTQKDEGKVLASEFGKFARFLQSEVAKSSTKETEATAT